MLHDVEYRELRQVHHAQNADPAIHVGDLEALVLVLAITAHVAGGDSGVHATTFERRLQLITRESIYTSVLTVAGDCFHHDRLK